MAAAMAAQNRRAVASIPPDTRRILSARIGSDSSRIGPDQPHRKLKNLPSTAARGGVALSLTTLRRHAGNREASKKSSP
jgi:hypothetical protein